MAIFVVVIHSLRTFMALAFIVRLTFWTLIAFVIVVVLSFRAKMTSVLEEELTFCTFVANSIIKDFSFRAFVTVLAIIELASGTVVTFEVIVKLAFGALVTGIIIEMKPCRTMLTLVIIELLSLRTLMASIIVMIHTLRTVMTGIIIKLHTSFTLNTFFINFKLALRTGITSVIVVVFSFRTLMTLVIVVILSKRAFVALFIVVVLVSRARIAFVVVKKSSFRTSMTFSLVVIGSIRGTLFALSIIVQVFRITFMPLSVVINLSFFTSTTFSIYFKLAFSTGVTFRIIEKFTCWAGMARTVIEVFSFQTVITLTVELIFGFVLLCFVSLSERVYYIQDKSKIQINSTNPVQQSQNFLFLEQSLISQHFIELSGKSFITMFDDMFDTPEDLLAGEGTQVLSSWERLPRNCADKLPLPQIPRKLGYPMGLKNQGATCYLNSLFQILFHTPQLRKLILQLPLCLQNAQTPSGLVSEARHRFLLGFQRLFSEMSECDQKAVGTEYLNKAFGWQNAQHLQQQDIQEAMRIIFDTIERALFGTEYYQSVRSLFRGSTIRYKTCRACGQTAERPEVFYDLQLQVKGASSVNEALSALTTAEGMQGDNAIFCDICQAKQDMWLGTRLNQLPGTLVLTLNRFDFDYQKFDRVKLNNYFEYQLQLDLSGFVMPHSDPGYNKYELYGVVIHRGSAHGGHYLCFARDLLHETDWKNGLAQATAQEARIKEGSTAKNKDKQNEDKQFKLKEPQNKDLLSNWYQINDNVATAISANKLTTKYEGSDSAYILFYRRKSLVVNSQKIRLPAYFSGPITEANKVMAKEREVYESEKKHIILNINGNDHKLKAETTINEFKQTYISQGSALVLQHQHNGLPYYPLQIVNSNDVFYQENETLISLEVPHESKFTTYQIMTPQYEQIKSTIGKSRLPFEVVLLVDGQNPKRIVAYNDQNLVMLRMKIEKVLSIPYEHQVITLVTPYKQTILTQTLTNDEMLLPKLGITHGVQLLIKTFSAEEEEGTKEQKKVTNEHLICFVIQRDDVIGLKRFYYQKTKTLQQLLNYFLNMEALNDNLKRRFRNLNGNRLYYTEHYGNTLQSFDFSEQMVRLRLQRGEIPIKGDICVKIKMQSTLAKTETQIPEEAIKIQKIFDPNTPILQVKEWACNHYQLDVSLHKLYLTDWMTEPVRSLTREKLTLFQANFGREQTLCLRDIYSPIGAELVHLQVFATVTGSPDNTIKQGIHVKIQQFKTVGDLKQLLITTLELKDVTIERLRLRQIKRDYMFGSVWRDNNKSVKSVTINSNKIVYQVLQEPEALTDDQVVLILKQRNKEKRLYENPTEIIFQAGRTPSVQQLIEVVKAKVGQPQIYLVKYFHYNFEWSELSRKNIQALAKNKKGNNQKGKKQDQPKGKNQQKKKQQTGQTQQKKNKEEGKPKNKKEQKPKPQKEQKTQGDVQKTEKTVQNGEQKHQQVQNVEVKGKKEKKGGKNDQQKQLLQECQNLRKAPVLLKDGDILGWGLLSELQGDDLQTDEDLAWRVQLKNQPTKYKGKQAGGFKLNVDF